MAQGHQKPTPGLVDMGGRPSNTPSVPCRLIRMALLSCGLAIIACINVPEGQAALSQQNISPLAEQHLHTLSNGSPRGLLLAERVETRDQIIYKTDSGAGKTFQELEREEKEKEDRSWQMLENIEIYPSRPVKPRGNSARDGQYK